MTTPAGRALLAALPRQSHTTSVVRAQIPAIEREAAQQERERLAVLFVGFLRSRANSAGKVTVSGINDVSDEQLFAILAEPSE